MECRHARQLLSEWTDGRVAGALRLGVEEHLKECGSCRREEQELRRTWELLDNYPAIEPSPGFAARIMARVRRPLILRFLAPIAAAAAVVVVSLLLFLPRTSVKPVPPQATEEERELVENLDLLENLDTLATLEMVADESALGPDGKAILEGEEHR
ncbi:MAG: zf-HC2 domain-containing protein [Planctomycetes bacterium]|nr:zf-HC2 domain-containing protein [Planctomycetota bacterium]